jgi:hypothetical protein
MIKVLNLPITILLLLSVSTGSVTAQQFIDELIVDFDGSPSEVVSIITINDIDSDGVFNVNNGAFEITDVEGSDCGDASMTGFNDNLAIIAGGVALRNYCNVTVSIEASISGADFEDCLNPNGLDPRGCTTFGVTEPGGDGVVVTILIGGNEVLVGGYCGSNPIGRFRTSSPIDVSIGDFIQVNIAGGTQSPDESYFINRILVQGTERSMVQSQIVGDENYCEGLGAITLNAIPQGGSNHRWFLDGVSLNNDNNETYISPTPALSEEGLYRVEFNEPGGCPTSAEFKINVTDCATVAPNFSIPNRFCSNQSLSLPTNSISGLTGEWNVPPDLYLEDQVGTLDIVFTPDNGGIPFMQTIQVNQAYCDTVNLLLCAGETAEVNGRTFTSNNAGFTIFDDLFTQEGCDSIIHVRVETKQPEFRLIEDPHCVDDTITLFGVDYFADSPRGFHTLPGMNTCDTIITIALNFVVPEERRISGIFCTNEFLQVAGETFDFERPSGVLTFTTDLGCDSMVVVDLDFVRGDTITTDVMLCPGETEMIRGIEVDESFLIDDYFGFGPNNCDTVLNFNVVNLEVSILDTMAILCPDDSVVVNGTVYDINNQFGVEMLTSLNGCDSIINVDLTYLFTSESSIRRNRCEGDNFSIVVNNQIYDESNPVGVEFLTNAAGCDSTVEVALNFAAITTDTLDHLGCSGDGYNVVIANLRFDERNPVGNVRLTNDAGCDSLVNINLVFNDTEMEEITHIGCMDDGFQAIVDGTLYDQNNPFGVEELVGANGCDSIVVIDLSFLQASTGEVVRNGCVGDSFSVMINNQRYDESNPFGQEILVNAAGCDSTVTVDLSFFESSSNEITHAGCEGDGFNIRVNNVLYDETNPIGQEILTNAAGCDSIVDINLSFAVPTDETIEHLGCEGDGFSMRVGTMTFDESNPTGSVMLMNRVGCDSLVSIDLTFQPNQLNEIVHNGCEGDGFTVEVDSIVYDENNRTGIVILTGANGCDSTVTVDLTFLESSSNEITHRGCEGDGFMMVVNNVLYDETNPIGQEILTNAAGCDSIVDINLSFAAPSDETLEHLGCEGDGFSIRVGAMIFDESNPTGSVMLTNRAGCDSLVNVNFIFQQNIINDIVHNGCVGDGFSIEVDGLIYNESNPTARIDMVGANGCDSTINVDLSFSSTILNRIVHDGCEGDGFSVEVNNIIYDETNPIGEASFITAAGCDSTVEVALTFSMATDTIVDYLGCIGDGFSVRVNNTLYNEEVPRGMETLPNAAGCDSTVTIDLVFQDMIVTDVDDTRCSGDGFFVEVNGVIYDESNPFGTEMATAASGCDSLIMVDLVFSPSDTTMVGGVLCSNVNAFRVINETVYDETNTSGVELLQNVNGCDSVLIVDFTFVEGVTTQLTDTLCSQSSITVGSTTYDRFNSVGTEIFTMSGGCDSTVEVNLTFLDEPTFSVGVDRITGSNSFQLTVNNADLINSIQWDSNLLDCTDCIDPIITTAENTGVTARIIDSNGCETSVSVPIIVRQDDVNVYIPNAMSTTSTQGNDILRPVVPDGIEAAYDLDIFDRYGGVLFRLEGVSAQDENTGWTGLVDGELVQNGVYIYKMVVYIDGLDPIVRTGTIMVF